MDISIQKGEGVSQAIKRQLIEEEGIQENQFTGSIWSKIHSALKDDSSTITHNDNEQKIGDLWVELGSSVKTYAEDELKIEETTWAKIKALFIKSNNGTQPDVNSTNTNMKSVTVQQPTDSIDSTATKKDTANQTVQQKEKNVQTSGTESQPEPPSLIKNISNISKTYINIPLLMKQLDSAIKNKGNAYVAHGGNSWIYSTDDISIMFLNKNDSEGIDSNRIKIITNEFNVSYSFTGDGNCSINLNNQLYIDKNAINFENKIKTKIKTLFGNDINW